MREFIGYWYALGTMALVAAAWWAVEREHRLAAERADQELRLLTSPWQLLRWLRVGVRR